MELCKKCKAYTKDLKVYIDNQRDKLLAEQDSSLYFKIKYEEASKALMKANQKIYELTLKNGGTLQNSKQWQ